MFLSVTAMMFIFTVLASSLNYNASSGLVQPANILWHFDVHLQPLSNGRTKTLGYTSTIYECVASVQVPLYH